MLYLFLESLLCQLIVLKLRHIRCGSCTICKDRLICKQIKQDITWSNGSNAYAQFNTIQGSLFTKHLILGLNCDLVLKKKPSHNSLHSAYLVDSDRFSIQLNHVHDSDGIVCIFLSHELHKTIPLMCHTDPVLRHVHIH